MKVGIIGLGNMGEQIARAIARAGFKTHLYDVRPETVERLASEENMVGCSSVKELAQESDAIGVVVLNEAQVASVADEVVATGLPRTLIIHSTVTPAFVQELAAAVAPAGVKVIDATVAGGVARAKTGQLTVMVGGDDATVGSVREVLEAIARDVFVVGPAGAGSAMKLAVNFMTISSYALEMEAMEFVRAHGISEDALSSVLTTSSADSRAVRTWGFHDRLRRSAPPGTAPSQVVMRKDVSSFARAGARAGSLMPLATIAAETLLPKIAERDAYLDSLGEIDAVPRCARCTLELIPPFREAGAHPECADI
ncbi:NAD(P)-dependent oxidoreductase [Williamsia muralis]|uniref:3-hydroxyisobutyrate dehydrogenase n=1 Tax=Williamsia marianensis TaxID=85044 RepID=A0A2G3PK21_WILMA|nr:NAD(P)-dependent oxidoreductase [Williamsia marianensis]PHV66179.1 hypothetical protein CSW57_21420 [Williamsia marianensis]